MKIGVIGGSGGIAAKAYLPVYASLQAEHEFIFYSRDLTRAETVRARYNFGKATNLLANLDRCDLVFIHVATTVHYELAKHFLEAGVHLVMDKPVTESLTETQELFDLAAAKNLLFVIAFNRRFIPAVRELKALPDKTFIKITKNTLPTDKSTQFALYDEFIHPLDTLIYLLDDEIIKIDTQLVSEAGHLDRAVVILQTPTTTGLASLNHRAGAFQEEFTVEAKSATKRLTDLAELETFADYSIQTGHFHGWESTPYVRGFDQIVRASITAVQQFDGRNREKLLAELKQERILVSHQIINQMLQK